MVKPQKARFCEESDPSVLNITIPGKAGILHHRTRHCEKFLPPNINFVAILTLHNKNSVSWHSVRG